MTFKKLHEDIDYNAHNMGEMGIFIRTEYAHNKINDCEKKVKDALMLVLFITMMGESYHDDTLREKCYWQLINELGLE